MRSDRGELMAGAPFWDPAPAGAVDIDGHELLYGEGPTFMENPWDVVYFDGSPLPGLCEIKAEQELQVDQKKSAGSDGARLTLGGYVPGPIIISMTIWTHAQWNEYCRVRPKFWRPPLKDNKDSLSLARDLGMSPEAFRLWQSAVKVGHPWTTAHGITDLIVRGISPAESGPVPQSKTIRLKCVQYLPPSSKAAPSKIRGDRTNVPTARPYQEAAAAAGILPPHEDAGPRGLGRRR